MAMPLCGCGVAGCGCCDGTTVLTPAPVWNRAGLPAVTDRIGTHGAFLETMKARLQKIEIDAPGPDGQTIRSYRPLQALTTRDPSDPAIALLDGWAVLADVLTFYQERITNEGYLRTATERGSLMALSRTVGYLPRPGVAASTFLWYTLDASQTVPVDIPEGSAAQSVPGPGEQPQTFETSDDLLARPEWNALPVRQSRPQNITLLGSLTQDAVYLSAANLNLKAGDALLFVFDSSFIPTALADPSGSPPASLRIVASVDNPSGGATAKVNLVPLAALLAGAIPLLAQLRDQAISASGGSTTNTLFSLARVSQQLLTETLLGAVSRPGEWPRHIQRLVTGGDVDPQVDPLIAQLTNAIALLEPPGIGTPVFGGPDSFVPSLLMSGAPQVANALLLPRNLSHSFSSGRDATPQLLIDTAPRIGGKFYTAWANALVPTANPALVSLHVLRTTASPFGANAQRLAGYNGNVPLTPDHWTDWTISSGDGGATVALDQTYDQITAGGYALLIRPGTSGEPARVVTQVLQAGPVSRSDYGLNGKVTQLDLARPLLAGLASNYTMANLRASLIRAQSEQLTVAELPITDPIGGGSAPTEIELAQIVNSLQPGRWLVISGERTDIPGVTGVTGEELAMLSGLRHGFDDTLPGDATRTTLILATAPAYQYRRDTVVVSANVAHATQGATRNETLGAGDATQAFQSFTLKQSPLTFVSAPNAAGVDSTLRVFVDNVPWTEVPSLASAGPRDRSFVTRIADNGTVTVTFGDGITGARPSTGVENITAIYRQGIGGGGNVKQDQVSLLVSRPLGVRGVTNPLEGSGGAEPESGDLIRANVPLATAALDRVVSLEDYASFSRTFAGVAKAVAAQMSDGTRPIVHVTLASVDDGPIDPNSDLYRNLVTALQQLGDPTLPLVIAARERVTLVLAANVQLLPGFRWETVAPNITAALLDKFGFASRDIGQAALLSEILAAMQGVTGVSYVDVDAFGGVPERTADNGTRRLLTLDEISQTVAAITGSGQTDESPITNMTRTNMTGARRRGRSTVPRAVPALAAGLDQGTLRPAQLAIFTDAVPETIALNQII